MATIQTKLKPGTYRLMRDIAPLRKDKRKTRDWKCNPVTAGTLFFYSEFTYSPHDDDRSFTEHRLYPVGCYSSESVAPNESSATRELEELLIPVDDTPSLWLRREHSSRSGLAVLDRLCAEGKLTLAEVQAAAKANDEEDES